MMMVMKKKKKEILLFTPSILRPAQQPLQSPHEVEEWAGSGKHTLIIFAKWQNLAGEIWNSSELILEPHGTKRVHQDDGVPKAKLEQQQSIEWPQGLKLCRITF